jgi:exonuclease III
MNALDQVREYIQGLNKQQFQRYLLALFAGIFLISSFIVYRYYSNISTLKKKIVYINNKRKEIKELLERYEIVQRQQEDVDALLEKEQNFKIGGYFNTVMNQVNITKNKTRDPETSSEVLDNGYTEIKLYASFSDLNMQKLTELLDTLEQKERIYTKDLEIYKPNQGPTINVNLLIATLEPKVETEEITE